jgi:hypothetical protein
MQLLRRGPHVAPRTSKVAEEIGMLEDKRTISANRGLD